MSYTSTFTDSTTFTISHARHIAAKIATDLTRIQRIYGGIFDPTIADYEAEAITFMQHGFLGYVWYGFNRNGLWVEPTLKYTSKEVYGDAIDDSPGKIRPGADVSGARFTSFLSYNHSWWNLTPDQRSAIEASLPFRRVAGTESSVYGYLSNDKTYSAGGRTLDRHAVRSF